MPTPWLVGTGQTWPWVRKRTPLLKTLRKARTTPTLTVMQWGSDAPVLQWSPRSVPVISGYVFVQEELPRAPCTGDSSSSPSL